MATRKVKTAEQPEPVEAPIEIQTVVIALPKELADVEARLATLCRKDRAALVRLRTAVEAIRVECKRPILDAGRKLDAETSRVRVEGIKAKIAAMDRRPMFGAKASDIMGLITDLPMIVGDDVYEEFTEIALAARDRAFDELTAAHAQAVAVEKAAADLAAQLEAANVARREAEERERVALAAQVEAERIARAETEAREKAEVEAAGEQRNRGALVATIEEHMPEAVTPIDDDTVAVRGSVSIANEIQHDDLRLPRFSMELHPNGPHLGKPVAVFKPLFSERTIGRTATFGTLKELCRHVYNIVSDDSDADTKVRVISVVMSGNDHLWADDDANTGGGGGVDERKPDMREVRP